MKIRKNKHLWIVRTSIRTVEISKSIKCPKAMQGDYNKGFNDVINIFGNASILISLLRLKKGIPIKIRLLRLATLSKYHQRKKLV